MKGTLTNSWMTSITFGAEQLRVKRDIKKLPIKTQRPWQGGIRPIRGRPDPLRSLLAIYEPGAYGPKIHPLWGI